MARFVWKIGETSFSEEFDEVETAKLPEEVEKSDLGAAPQKGSHKGPSEDESTPNGDDNRDNPDEKKIPMENEMPGTGDILFGFHTMALIAETARDNGYLIDEDPFPLDLAPVFQFVNASKNYLVEMDRSLGKYISESENGDLARSAYAFIDRCRTIFTEGEPVDRSTLQSNYAQLFSYQSDTRETALEILDYLEQRDDETKQPYHLYERLATRVSREIVVERRTLVRRLSYARQYYPASGGPLVCQLVLDDEQYRDYIAETKTYVIFACSETGTKYLNTSSIGDPGFAGAVDAMRKCIDPNGTGSNGNSGNNNNGYPFGGYRGKNDKCFAVFDVGNDRYISLSCVRDTDDQSIINYMQFDDKSKRRNAAFKNSIKQLIVADPLLQGSTYSEANLNVISNIPKKETFSFVISINRSGEGGRFSCCERKMISRVSSISAQPCYMFTRHRPCVDCEKSLSQFNVQVNQNMKVYYLNDDPKNPTDDSIKEYQIK